MKITCEPEANTPLRKGSGFGRSGDEGELSVTDPVMAEMTGCRSCGDEQQEHGSGDDQHKKHAPTVAGVIVGQYLTITWWRQREVDHQHSTFLLLTSRCSPMAYFAAA